MKPDLNQKKAIENIDSNILVNAGAGTGKTRVLVERYIWILENGKLLEGKEIESIVAITFTKKAAEEMKSRIRNSLRERFSQDKKWRRLYRDIEKSNISTIHSFCGNILKEHPIESGIDPMFEILDENEGNELLKNTIFEVLSEEIEKDMNLYNLFTKLNVNTISGLVDDFYSLYNNIRNSSKGIEEIKLLMDKKLNSFLIDEDELCEIEQRIELLLQNLAKNAKIHRLVGDKYWEKFKNRKYNSIGELIDILIYIEDFLGTSKKEEENINIIKSKINHVSKAREIENIKLYYSVIGIVKKIDNNYQLKKKDNSSLDYDDLQIKTFDLLKNNKEIREYYQEKYRYIMIDEFQDTNELQKEIFYLLSTFKEKLDRQNLFVVGDPKQSIYGFRGANLDVFYKVKEDMENHRNGKVINLEENYRTSSNIMNFLNEIFENIMGHRYNRLNPNIFVEANLKRVEVLEKEDLIIPEDENASNYARYYEAQLIAKRIKMLINSGEYKYGDIALLFRAGTRNYIYEEALRDYNIPFYNTGGNDFFKKQEILDLENAFKAIFNPLDIISNIGFLRSGMIGLSDRVIFWILKEKEDIHKSIKKIIGSDNLDIKEEEELLKETLNLLEYLYDFKTSHTYKELLEEIVNKTLFKETLLLKDNGKQAIENVNKYIGFLSKYEKDNLKKSEDIITYINKIKSRRESSEIVESEDSNVVKIMTIHKSKGLEFPVVIIPELSTKNIGRYSNIKYDQDLGIGLKIENNSSIYESINEKEKNKEGLELQRVLYVAMTRAKELLILGMQGSNSGFKKILSQYLDENHCTNIKHINLDKDRKDKVSIINIKSTIDDELEIQIPNLLEFENYNKASINNSSISQYMTFKNCRREYFLKHRVKLSLDLFNNQDESLENDSLSGIELGNIVHDFAELYRKGFDKVKLLEDIFKKYDKEYKEHKDNINAYIKHFIDNYSEDFDEIRREEEISLIIEGIKFIGFIDRIDFENGKAIITDYKTNKLENKKELVDYYKPQLQFYAYALDKVSKYEVVESKALFLENGEYLKIDLDDEIIKETILDIENFVKYIKKYDNIEDYHRCEYCNQYCRYDIICNGS